MSTDLVPRPIVQASASNRRASRRLAARASATIEIRKGSLGMGKSIALRALDVSERGVRAIVNASLEKGGEVEIMLTGHGIRKPIKRIATVTWVVALEADQYEVGFILDKALPYLDIMKFAKA
jgi:hypothetical protein